MRLATVHLLAGEVRYRKLLHWVLWCSAHEKKHRRCTYEVPSRSRGREDRFGFWQPNISFGLLRFQRPVSGGHDIEIASLMIHAVCSSRGVGWPRYGGWVGSEAGSTDCVVLRSIILLNECVSPLYSYRVKNGWLVGSTCRVYFHRLHIILKKKQKLTVKGAREAPRAFVWNTILSNQIHPGVRAHLPLPSTKHSTALGNCGHASYGNTAPSSLCKVE